MRHPFVLKPFARIMLAYLGLLASVAVAAAVLSHASHS